MPSLVPILQALPRTVLEEKWQLIDDEWRMLPSFELPEHIKITDDIDVFWHKVLHINESDSYGITFKNLAKFVLDIVALPHTNADCERIFSAVNLSKTKIRNKLVTPTLNGILLSRQRVKNCVSFEPSVKEIKSMTTSCLYPKLLQNETNESELVII